MSASLAPSLSLDSIESFSFSDSFNEKLNALTPDPGEKPFFIYPPNLHQHDPRYLYHSSDDEDVPSVLDVIESLTTSVNELSVYYCGGDVGDSGGWGGDGGGYGGDGGDGGGGGGGDGGGYGGDGGDGGGNGSLGDMDTSTWNDEPIAERQAENIPEQLSDRISDMDTCNEPISRMGGSGSGAEHGNPGACGEFHFAGGEEEGGMNVDQGVAENFERERKNGSNVWPYINRESGKCMVDDCPKIFLNLKNTSHMRDHLNRVHRLNLVAGKRNGESTISNAPSHKKKRV
uniref:C2H2-type domain-containing protein n=1 Tax=Panagrolaimus davidi TaxID=227884 RepID=A0A914QQM3_9BILA